MTVAARRVLPVGADVQPQGLVSFRVWAPKCERITLVLEHAGGPLTSERCLDRTDDGYHQGMCHARAGDRYWFRLDDAKQLLPDPASRFQPDGPHGPSVVVDPSTFEWTDADWPGIDRASIVVYEMHVGTFTREGTWRAAVERLPDLAELGISVIEVLPIADFAGRFGWGYDGVNLFAPTRLYGTPDDLRFFVDRAHAAGLGVILDVVYNHVGPSGAYFDRFTGDFFAERETEWGRSINFDGPNSGPVREFFVANAGYWIEEFHFDGLRLDATQSIGDQSADHILAVIARRVREAAGPKSTWIVAENEPQKARMIRAPRAGGFGLDALWNDDFHHSAVVALTGRREAYYTDYLGHPQEFVSAAKHGFLYQGQWYRWQANVRGTPSLDLPASAFVAFLENHDQVANSARGQRMHQMTSPALYRAMVGLLLLGPWTPMLFQGEELGSRAPFLYFADHEPDLAKAVHNGRVEFLSQFPRLTEDAIVAQLDDPGAADTFERCKLDHDHRDPQMWRLHAELLRLRRADPVMSSETRRGFDGAVLSQHAFVIRFFGAPADGDRLVVVNLGPDDRLPVLPEPLLAPLSDQPWQLLWSSEDPAYGGLGVPEIDAKPGLRLPAQTTLFFASRP